MIKGKEGKQGTVNKLRQRQRKQKHMGRVDNKVGGNTPPHTHHTHMRESGRESGERERENNLFTLSIHL